MLAGWINDDVLTFGAFSSSYSQFGNPYYILDTNTQETLWRPFSHGCPALTCDNNMSAWYAGRGQAQRIPNAHPVVSSRRYLGSENAIYLDSYRSIQQDRWKSHFFDYLIFSGSIIIMCVVQWDVPTGRAWLAS